MANPYNKLLQLNHLLLLAELVAALLQLVIGLVELSLTLVQLLPDHIGGIFVAVQVGEGENSHDLAYRNKIAPSRAEKVENTFTKFSGSFRKNTPIRRAKTMLVSRSAVTNAIGAWVKAHVTTA